LQVSHLLHGQRIELKVPEASTDDLVHQVLGGLLVVDNRESATSWLVGAGDHHMKPLINCTSMDGLEAMTRHQVGGHDENVAAIHVPLEVLEDSDLRV